MTEVYVVRNQLGQFWGKAKAWTDGRDPRAIMRTAHQDEAMNTLFELSSKDIELRGEVVQVELSERREPIVEASKHLIEPEAREEPETQSEPAPEPRAEVEAEQASPGNSDDAEVVEEPSATC